MPTCVTPLLAVCDVLVLRALEVAGKRIVRADRSRFRVMSGRPWYVAHTFWKPDPEQVAKALERAWDTVPVLVGTYGGDVNAADIARCLDRYTADLLITGTAHNLDDLRYRLMFVPGVLLPADDDSLPEVRYA